jgi:U3 small nucleolar RNA-associated protein 22
VEILCASLFVPNHASKAVAHRDCSSIPRSKERGFCLIIQVLQNWNWNDPLFVPLHEQDASPTSGVLVPDTSTSAWALSTAVDIGGHVWTGPNLDDTIACRVQDLAKATWKTLGQVEGGLDVQVCDSVLWSEFGD